MKYSPDDEVRLISKQLFGNKYMLEVCVGIAEGAPDRVNLTALLPDSHLSPSVYVAPMKRLLAARFLREDPTGDDDRRERWYRPTKSKLWSAAVDISRVQTGPGST